MKWNVRLDPKELDALADDLLKYADTFEEKVRTFLSRLADLGIQVAKANGGIYGSYIVYSKDFETKDGDITVKMVANGETINSEWYPSAKSKELRSEAINTLLMAEFGSGKYAIDGTAESGEVLGGRGTLDPSYHHATSNGWGWWAETPSKDGTIITVRNGRTLYVSDGLAPAQPLHKAVMACIDQVNGIAQEVFG